MRDTMATSSSHTRLVYSTDSGRICPDCGQPKAQCVCGQPKAAPATDGVVRVLRETKGRGGKAVTLVKGVALDAAGLAALGKQLKAACGTGGCNLLVYSPGAHGYRRVADIGVTQVPIRASRQRAHGWRHLVVHVSGGGVEPSDVVLKFDGTGYPKNPTVRGSPARPGDVEDSEMLIDVFKAMSEARPLPVPTAPLASLDCAKARRGAQRMVCRDADLSALDRDLAAVHAKAMSPASEWSAADRAALKASQRAWLKARERCARVSDAHACMSDLYQRRLITLKIQLGDAGPVPAAVGYQCEGLAGTPVSVVFYSQFEPPAAVITVGDQQAVAFLERTASGARYGAPGLDFWEHHGEAQLTRARQRHTCSVLRAP